MATALSNFVETTLKDEMFRRLPDILPELRFRKSGRDWHSPLKLDLTDPKEKRADKCVVTAEYAEQHRSLSILENGESGKTEGVIDFYMRMHGINSFPEAVKAIAGKLGLTVPDSWDGAKYKEWEERQNALEAVSRKMRDALSGPSGVEVLDYLRGRGYSEDFIKFAEFGFCDSETAKEVAKLCPYHFNWGIGRTHTLSIPYRTGGRISGFVFRTLIEGRKDKYFDAFISENATKRYHLFGLTGLTLKGDEEQRREIVVVEGEIDALRASFAGVRNVCAASGGNIYPEAIEEAKRRGVERVKLLFDIGEGGTAAKIERAVGIISGFGLASFVCALPEEEGGKIDPDSFLRTHTAEELQTLLDGAEAGYVFLFRRLLADNIERQGGDGEESTFTDINIFVRETLRLYASNGITIYEKGIISSQFEEATGKIIDNKMLAEEAERRKREEDTERQRRETDAALTRARELLNGGKTAEAIEEMGKASALRGISREAEYERLLIPQKKEEILQRFRETPTGVETQYFFKTSSGGAERFVLPRGALTYICAPTSHGKSRMLENLALQIATDGKEGTVLYFTFEEDITAVQMEMLNIFADMELSKNNLKTLRTYYSKGEEQFFKAGTDKVAFAKRQEAFLSLCESGRLRVYYEEWDSTALIGFIRHAAERLCVKAVFVDYIQLLRKSGTNLQRKDELKEICNDFMRLSVDTELPIVLAAQLNREAYSPIDMAVQNISEASDIEHSANVVMLLWNSSSLPVPQKHSYSYKSKNKGEVEEKLCEEAKKIEERGFHIGKPGHIYAVLAKNRGGERNESAVFAFNGNSGAILPEEEDMPETPKRKNPLKMNNGDEIPFEQS